MPRPTQNEPPQGRVDVSESYDGPPPPKAWLPILTQPSSQAAASFRLLQYRVRHDCQARIVAVTSPEEGEGKTTCAINLAMALAEQSEGDVLLLEANLQKPAVSQRMGFVPPRCFGEQMHAGEDRALDGWQAVSAYFPNLHVLAVDPAVTKPRLLNRAALGAVMELLRPSHYESIVLDCPSALGSADMTIVADYVDGILLTSLVKHTRRSKLTRSAEVLAPATILGTVAMGER